MKRFKSTNKRKTKVALHKAMISFERQQKLIQQCIAERLSLRDVLNCEELTYENLRYRHSEAMLPQQGVHSRLQDHAIARHGIPAVSFFSGAGGLDLGFEAAGFDHLGSFEHNELFCQTLRTNRPHWKVFNEDMANHDRVLTILRDSLDIKAPFDGIFHGGPPCQPFSVASNQRFRKGTRGFKRTGFNHSKLGNLLFDYLFYIREFLPKYFLIENVPGLQDIDGGRQLEIALEQAAALNYAIIDPFVLNASDHQVPQDRKRLFIIGARQMKRSWAMPQPSPKIPCGSVLTSDVLRFPGHVIRAHEADSVARYVELEYGQRERMGRVDRLDPVIPSKTVIAGGTAGGGRSHLHPEIPRTLSPRETARLQTFPDGYIFEGPPARQLTQIGNAVPPILAAILARQIALMAGASLVPPNDGGNKKKKYVRTRKIRQRV
jgi:DNA (cytosine-5)-methyltransferase 1